MPRQLAFDLPVRAARGRGDFFVSPANALALAQVENDSAWPLGKLVLTGPEGAGKTHLVHVWAEAKGATILAADALAGWEPAGLDTCPRIAVEDAHRIAGNREIETALFHLHNIVLARQGRLLVTGRSAPARWGLVLPDLESRLTAAVQATLSLPDDSLLSAVLLKLFADRQIAVAPSLVPWLVGRMERSLGAAQDLVARLDARALAEGRPVGRALAAEVLDSMPTQGQ